MPYSTFNNVVIKVGIGYRCKQGHPYPSITLIADQASRVFLLIESIGVDGNTACNVYQSILKSCCVFGFSTDTRRCTAVSIGSFLALKTEHGPLDPCRCTRQTMARLSQTMLLLFLLFLDPYQFWRKLISFIADSF